MTKTGKISVIIPSWNNAASIKKAITSCLNQTLQPLEVLICDDGSTDKTGAIVKSIHSTLVKWHPGKKHSGRPAVPRNRGIKKAKGEWLAFLDADDEWLPGKLEEQIAIAKKTKCLAVCSNAFRKIKDGSRKSLYFNFPDKHLNLGSLLVTNYVICSSMLIHRSLLKKTGGFPENKKLASVEDYALWLRVAGLSDIYYLKKPLVIYNDSPKTSIRSKVKRNPTLTKIYILKDFFSWKRKI
jgi:teichuronic acid biosynthesis glycosyltransferase TuaG